MGTDLILLWETEESSKILKICHDLTSIKFGPDVHNLVLPKIQIQIKGKCPIQLLGSNFIKKKVDMFSEEGFRLIIPRNKGIFFFIKTQ